MPRKRKEGKPVDATGTELRAIRLELPAERQRAFRIAAAEQNTTMAALARRLVEEFLDKRAGEKPKGRGAK